MKRMLTAILAAAVAGALFVAAPLGAAPKGTENYNKSTVTFGDCEGDDTMEILAPEKLWPPNHKYYDGIYVKVTDGSGDNVDLVTAGTHDQYDGDTEMNGSGNTADDIRVNPDDTGASKTSQDGAAEFVAEESGSGSVQTDWQARSERSGRDQDGRQYQLRAESMSTDGDECSGLVTFEVPHDMRPSNR